MLNFNLLPKKNDKKTNLFIILSLIKKTLHNEIEWNISFNAENHIKYDSCINIENTNKEIILNYHSNKKNNLNNILIIRYKPDSKNSVVIKSLTGEYTHTLLNSIKNQLKK